MPIYAYRCSACGHAQDVLQKISDEVLSLCPACGAASYVKQVTAAGFQLKGSGWYVTDFRGGNTAGKEPPQDGAADLAKEGAKDSAKEGVKEGVKEGAANAARDSSAQADKAPAAAPAKTADASKPAAAAAPSATPSAAPKAGA